MSDDDQVLLEHARAAFDHADAHREGFQSRLSFFSSVLIGLATGTFFLGKEWVRLDPSSPLLGYAAAGLLAVSIGLAALFACLVGILWPRKYDIVEPSASQWRGVSDLKNELARRLSEAAIENAGLNARRQFWVTAAGWVIVCLIPTLAVTAALIQYPQRGAPMQESNDAGETTTTNTGQGGGTGGDQQGGSGKQTEGSGSSPKSAPSNLKQVRDGGKDVVKR